MIALLTVAVACIIWFSNNNATGALSQVNFPKVSIAEGSKFYLNGNKSLTAIKDGKLLADNTNGTAVASSQISSELSNFANLQYGSDAGKSYLTNPNLLSLEKLNSSRQYIPEADSDYWLDTNDSRGQISWRWFARSKNSTNENMEINVSGKDLSTGEEFEEDTIATGQIGATNTYKLSDYQASEGGKWRYNDNTVKRLFNVFKCSPQAVNRQDVVYNNIDLKNSGIDPNGYKYASTSVSWVGVEQGAKIFAYVKNRRIIQVNSGEKIPAGTVVMFCFPGNVGHLEDVTDFAYSEENNQYTVFKRLTNDIKVNSFVEKKNVYGVTKYYISQKSVYGSQLISEKYAIRPAYAYDVSKIAYIKNNVSGSVPTSSILSNVPTADAVYRGKYKAVVKSSNTTIVNNICEDKLSTDRTSGSGNRPSIKYEKDTIKVPYSSTKLMLSDCFTTTNATHISALAENNGEKRYGVVAQNSSSDVTLDLTNLLATTQVGSTATLSFYAEKINGDNISDEISDKAVTVKIEVVEGVEQTITYANGGGIGNLPSAVKIKAGNKLTLANGSSLAKDGNPFSCWQLKYTDFATGDEETRFVKEGETVNVPDASDGNITATAMYAGVSAQKSIQSGSTVFTVTWDANLPDGVSVISWTGASKLSDDLAYNYQKIKLVGSTVALSSAPTINTTEWVFDGWYDLQTGGNKLTGQTTAVNESVTYYAHWVSNYVITFNLNAPEGQTCTWGGVTSPDTLTSSAKAPNFIVENPSTVTGDPSCTTDSHYGFGGWYDAETGGNAITVGVSTVSGNKTIYAHWWTKDVFLAKVDGTGFDPTDFSTYANADITNIADVKAVATTIASGGTNPDATKYNATNDQYHLFARIGGSATSTTANDWLECRIIHVGQHDSDGSGLTFQAVHVLPNITYKWDTVWVGKDNERVPTWSKTTLRTNLNSKIYDRLPDLLRTNIKQVIKKSNQDAWIEPNGGSIITSNDKLWILSYTELVKNSLRPGVWTDASHDGSVYQFWASKDLVVDKAVDSGSEQAKLLKALVLFRDGSRGDYNNTNSFLRSLGPGSATEILRIHYNGYINSEDGDTCGWSCFVIPAFAM